MVSMTGLRLELRNVFDPDGPVGIGTAPAEPINMVDPAFYGASQPQGLLTVGAGNRSDGFWAGTEDPSLAWLAVSIPDVGMTILEAILTLR